MVAPSVMSSVGSSVQSAAAAPPSSGPTAGQGGMGGGWQEAIGGMSQSGSAGGGMFNWMQTLRSGLLDSYYGRGLAKGMAPIYAQQSTASMLQAVVQQRNYMNRLKRRKDLMTDVEDLKSPAAIMERARKMEGYGDDARRMLAEAKLSDNAGAVLDAIRGARRGAEHKQAINLGRAGKESELAIQSRLGDYEASEIEAANKERIQRMLFGLFGQQLEAKKYKVGAKMQTKVAKHGAISGALTLS